MNYDIMVKKGGGHVLIRLDEFLEMAMEEQAKLILASKLVFVRAGKIVPAARALREIRLAQWSA
ncbi:MAG: hypothetical protein R2939_16470 [Kofleriaceae bacterium]